MGYNTKPMIQQVRDVTPLDIKKINDNFSNLDIRLKENQENSSVLANKILATNIEFYSNGMTIDYTDNETKKWIWTFNELGKITSLENITDNKTIDINWNEGGVP